MKPRIFHLFDFPENIYIELSPKFRKNLFDKAISKVKTRYKLAKYLNVDYKSVVYWYNGYRKMYGRSYKEYIPLQIIKRLSSLCKIPEKIFEHNIISYKCRSAPYSVKNPKFPLFESEEMIRILSHFIGDGCGKRNPCYANKCKALCIQFKEDLNIFGEVHTNMTYYDKNDIYHLCTLKVIPNLLRHFYNVELETFTSRVPAVLYKLPKHLAGEFLKAFIDDEGNVGDNGIRIYSGNKQLIEGIHKLIKTKFPRIQVTDGGYSVSAREYTLKIPKKVLPLFVAQIGNVYHPSKNDKICFLLSLIKHTKKRQFYNGKWYETRKDIFEFVKNNPSTVHELSREFMFTESSIRRHLVNLKKDNLVDIVDRINTGARVWGTNDI